MAKASINFAKAAKGGLAHNDRSESREPDYLLPAEFRLQNEVDRSAGEAEKMISDLYRQAKDNYRQKFGQKLQAKSYVWEAVVNLNKEHTLDDVQRLAKAIEKETGFTSVQVAIHRDEGHINERGVPQYNLHAHLTFFTLDRETGEQLYRRQVTEKQKERGIQPMNRERLSKLQDLTAEVLGMERGKRGSKAVRLDHKAYKEAKRQELAKVKDLTAEIKELRAELKANGAKREDYARLEAENKQLKEKIKAKDLTIEDLKQQIEDLRKDLTRDNAKDEKIEQYRELLLDQEERIDALIEQNKALQAKISTNESQSMGKAEKMSLNPSKIDLNGSFEDLFEDLKAHSRDFENTRTEEMFLKSSIKSTLERDIDQLVDRHTSQREIKSKFGLVSEFVDVVDKKALKEEIKELQKEHKSNYAKFDKFLDLFKKPANAVMRKIQDVQSKIFMQKVKSKSQEKNQGLKR